VTTLRRASRTISRAILGAGPGVPRPPFMIRASATSLSGLFCVPASFLRPLLHPARALARLRPIFRPQQLYSSRDDVAQGQPDHFSRHSGGGASSEPPSRFARRLRRCRGAFVFRHPFCVRSHIRLAPLSDCVLFFARSSCVAVATTLRRASRTIARAILGVGRPPTPLKVKDPRADYVVVGELLRSGILSVSVPNSGAKMISSLGANTISNLARLRLMTVVNMRLGPLPESHFVAGASGAASGEGFCVSCGLSSFARWRDEPARRVQEGSHFRENQIVCLPEWHFVAGASGAASDEGFCVSVGWGSFACWRGIGRVFVRVSASSFRSHLRAVFCEI